MASITGLANIKSLIDKPKGNDGPKARWLKLDDGQSIKIRFLNEVDADSKSYNAENGLAIVVAEHTNPKDYRRKAACTLEEEGRCFGCEMHRRDPKAGWKARLRYYTNVMVDDGTEDPYVAIWSQGVGPKSPTTTTISPPTTTPTTTTPDDQSQSQANKVLDQQTAEVADIANKVNTGCSFIPYSTKA
jgi:hypothetical protein